MSRYIDADALKTKKRHSTEFHENVVAVAEIDWMPTIDAVPVVRCGDCRWWSKDEPDDEYGYCYNGKIIGSTKENWFCADGKRRTDEQQT